MYLLPPVCRFLLRFRPSSASTVRTKECNDSFQQLKAALLSTPVLAYHHSAEPFVLDTDATNVDIGAVLSQVHHHYLRAWNRLLKKRHITPERVIRMQTHCSGDSVLRQSASTASVKRRENSVRVA